MISRRAVIMCCLVCSCTCAPTFGQGKSRLVRETAEHLLRRFGVELGEETLETLSAKIGRYGSKYGDDAVEAIQTVGPKAFKLIDDAGENAPAVVQLLKRHGNAGVWVASSPRKLAIFVKYGDDAAGAMMKHPGVAAPVVEEFGSAGARALRSVSGQNGRRIAMMADDGSLAAAGNAEGILDVIARYGDRAADWVWRNKGALAIATVAAAFVADPEPFLDGVVEIARVGGETIVRPVAEKAAEQINWNMIVVVAVAIFIVLVIARFGWRRLLPRGNTNAAQLPEVSHKHAPHSNVDQLRKQRVDTDCEDVAID